MLKSIDFTNHKYATITVTVVLLLLSFVITGGVNLAIIIFSYLLTDRIFKKMLDQKVFDTKIFRKLTTFIIYAIILQCVILVSWLISHNFPLDLTPLFTLLILCIIFLQQKYLIKKDKPQKVKGHLPLFKFPDVIAVLVAIAFITPPVVTSFLTVNTVGQAANYLVGSNDDIHHNDFVALRLKYNRGILYQSDAQNEGFGFRKVSPTYPASWPAANAVVIKSVYPRISIGDASTIAYAITKLFWFMVVIYMFTKVLFTVYAAFRDIDKQPTTVSLLWISFTAMLFSRTYFMDVFAEGFYSFIPQILAVLLAIPLIIQLSNQIGKDRLHHGTLLMLAIVAIGGSLAWILLVPVFCLAVAIIIVDHIVSSRKNFIEEIKTATKKYWPFYGILFVAVGVQGYVSFPRKEVIESLPFVDALLTDGNFCSYHPEYYAMAIGCVLSMVLIRKKSKRALRYLAYMFVPIVILAGIIAFIQIGALHKPTYYFYKVLYAATSISLPVGLVGVALGLDWVEKHSSKVLAVIAMLILAFIFMQLFKSPLVFFKNC